MFVVRVFSTTPKFQKMYSKEADEVWGSGTGAILQLVNQQKILHIIVIFLLPSGSRNRIKGK